MELLRSLWQTRGFNISGHSNPEVFGRNDIVVDAMVRLSFLADEVNIPGFSVATGDFKGSVPGINLRYAHTRNFTEMNVAFLMDMDHTPLKFLRLWSDFIFGFEDSPTVSQHRHLLYSLKCNIIIFMPMTLSLTN